MDPNIPQIDENFPIPEADCLDLPAWTTAEEAKIRATTVTFLTKKADQVPVFRQNIGVPTPKQHTNATLAFLAGAIQQLDADLVDDPASLRRYIQNKLVYEVEHAVTPKDRLQALRMLGDMDNVGAFKQRVETTMTVRNLTDVEKDLRELIEREKKTITIKPEPSAASATRPKGEKQ